MPRDAITLSVTDVSAFAKRLRAELSGPAGLPGHLGFLNMIARAAGHANFQHLRAGAQKMPVAPAAPGPLAAEPQQADPRRIERVLNLFDGQGRMVRWPAKTAVQELCLWVLWAALPARTGFGERELNARIDAWHLFGDRALLRRSLIDHRLCERTQDGREYRRIERAPHAEALAVLKAMSKMAR